MGALAKSPLSRVFGRQMIFFKCAKKNEKLNCAMGQLKKWVEEWYGSGENITNTEYVSQRMSMRLLLSVQWSCTMLPPKRRNLSMDSFSEDTCNQLNLQQYQMYIHSFVPNDNYSQ